MLTITNYSNLYRVFQKKAIIEIQIRALIQTILKFIIAFEQQMRKITQFYTHGTLKEAFNHVKLHPLKLNTISCLN